jgi:hypothetical protein
MFLVQNKKKQIHYRSIQHDNHLVFLYVLCLDEFVLASSLTTETDIEWLYNALEVCWKQTTWDTWPNKTNTQGDSKMAEK